MCLFITSCEQNNIEEGIIIGKRYEKLDTNLIYLPITIGRLTIVQRHYIYNNEDWIITIEGYEYGKTIRQDVYVTGEYYETLNYGDTWIKTDDCSFIDNNNISVRYNILDD